MKVTVEMLITNDDSFTYWTINTSFLGNSHSDYDKLCNSW